MNSYGEIILLGLHLAVVCFLSYVTFSTNFASLFDDLRRSGNSKSKLVPRLKAVYTKYCLGVSERINIRSKFRTRSGNMLLVAL